MLNIQLVNDNDILVIFSCKFQAISLLWYIIFSYLSIVGIGASSVVLTTLTWLGSAGAAILSRAAFPMFITEFIQFAILYQLYFV